MPKRPTWITHVAVFTAGALFGVFSTVEIAPNLTTTSIALDEPQQDPGDPFFTPAPGESFRFPSTQPSAASSDTAPGNDAGLECAAGRNGGATDVGVTATEIHLATTTVESGVGAAFLGEAKLAMEAVRNKVNRSGGICGRQLKIVYSDDGWEANRGAGTLRNYIHEGKFALPVVPSSEGLRVVIESGDIGKAGIPVVGADGMLEDQYTEPWVWPVSVATTSSARIMARNAYARGARKFSIVFDKNYRFGVEAAAAYNSEVKRLTENDVPGFNKDNNCVQSFCGVLAAQSSYATEVEQFEAGEFVALFLEPQTALVWMSGATVPKPSTVKYGVGAAQPLFTRDFAVNCQKACHGMWAWTSYRPPIESYKRQAAVQTYVNDMKATKPDIDVTNAFSQGAYIGMQLLVQAIKEVGPNLTRTGLKQVLDRTSLKSGLTIQESIGWSPDKHRSNTTMQAFEIQYKGTFAGWREKDIVTDGDPYLGIN